MLRCLLACCGCLSLTFAVGCAVCASPHDYQYAAYGGIRQRTDMVHGRLGSVFDPAPEISHVERSKQSPADTREEEQWPAPEGDPDDMLREDRGDAEPWEERPELPEVPDEGEIELPELPSLEGDQPEARSPLQTRARPRTDDREATPRNVLAQFLKTQL